ncbi:hypothetical protein ACFL31_03015 [Candidatus Margulisiibacteriota bacterium]
MLKLPTQMAKKTLETIKSIEQKAAAIIKQAKQNATLFLIKARERQAQELQVQTKNLKQETEALIKKAEAEAKAEAQDITNNSKKETEALNKATTDKISQAQKEIQKCL